MSHACRFGFVIPEGSDSGNEVTTLLSGVEFTINPSLRAAQDLEGLVNIERYSLYKKEIV